MEAVKSDYRSADLTESDRGMLDFVVKLTLEPGKIVAADLNRLRALEFDDEAIHDIVQVTALFGYYNRLADGLGVHAEPEWSSAR